MKLEKYLTPQRVTILQGRTKAEALSEMAGLIAAGSGGVSREEIEKAIWHREKLMSTGIGYGLAIPHVRMAGLRHAVMAVGVKPDGIEDYKSLDDCPIRIIVMIAAPQGQHELYINLLARVTEVLRHQDFRESLLRKERASDIHEALAGAAES